jgi:FkbM family methyltransferase
MLPQVNIVRAKHGDFLAFFESQGISGVLTAVGVWDELTIAIASKILEKSSVDAVVYDVGANIGTFAIPIAKLISARGGVVRCFEPQRIVYYQLCGNVFLNRLDNVFTYNAAVDSVDREAEIKPLDFSKAWNIGGYSLMAEADPQSRDPKPEKCRFLTLDGMVTDESVSLVKIDVEGMEFNVIQGAIGFLTKHGFPPILFESRDTDAHAKLARYSLATIGYKIAKYGEHDYLAQHESRAAVL